jgi:hypothetical protein
MSRLVSLLTVFLLASCNTEKSAERVVHDSVHQMDFIFEYDPGPPLSAPEDRIYANTAKGRELIFEGYNAPKITIKSFRKGVLIVEYCGGSIRKVASFLYSPDNNKKVEVVKVQPVVISNVLIDGNRICSE